ncbi:MAG: DUF1631 domain-containing protein [Gammaproteobacteria bacterium]|nr:DUF1631 domain-containing protein [Gammaproteobacteria bacterium]
MQATPNSQAWTTSILDECHKLVRSYLSPHLQKMFENSNLAFLEFAEKAQSSASQIQFMEALTVIQKNRSQVEEVFQREIGSSFARLGNSQLHESHSARSDESPLSLLSKEDTDIEVAIKNMTSSATNGASQELYALRQRLAVLNNGRKVEYEDVPAGPHCLAMAFHDAARDLLLEHETKLIVYMLFDKFVLSKLAPLYHKYNERLLKAGLLPNLKYEARKNPVTGKIKQAGADAAKPAQNDPQQPAANAPAGQPESGQQSLGDELFGNIMNLLARRDGRGSGAGAAGNTGNAGGAGRGQNDPSVSNPLPQTEIVTAIDKVQHAAPVEGITAEQVATIQPGTQEHQGIISTIAERLTAERKQLFTGIDRRRMPAADTQVIDLVGMIFEHMLKDEDLPNVAKAELSRLHTPYLKIAIIDKRFFSDNTHPAHELLNTLANAGARWVFEDDLDRGIFPSLRNTVQRVINEFVNNIELFSELLGSFNRSLNELIDRASAIEERTKQAAAGKEKLGMARNQAAEAIEACVSGHNVPSSIRKLLGDVWLDKLMFIFLREPDGQNSASWRLAIQTIEDIIWSVEPRFSEESQAELLVKLPVLRTRIEQAFADLETYGSNDRDEHQQQVIALQEEALRQPADEQLAAIEAEEAATQAADADDAEVSGDVAEPEEEPLAPEVQAGLEKLKTVAFGTWFFIQESRKDHPVRVKLSWYSQMSGNYMFVDSMGVKSTVWKQNELAALIADGRARIIEETRMPFLKRALIAIRQILTGDRMLSDE